MSVIAALAHVPTTGSNITDFENSESYGPTPEQLVRILERRERARAYRPSLLGRGGTLANGVRWWLTAPRPDQDIHGDMVVIRYSDPRPSALSASALSIEEVIEERGMEQIYADGMEGFARMLKQRHFVPAEQGDPDSFCVKWEVRS